jgi:hypothetical protein
MAQAITHPHRVRMHEEEMQEADDVSGWVGWIAFATFMLMLGGVFHSIVGLMAIFNSTWFAVTPQHLVVWDLTTWGWAHLLVGIIMFIGGISLMSGRMWARILAVLLAGISLVAYFVSIQMYPLWAIIGMTVAALVIFAVIVHGREMQTLHEAMEE